MRLGTRDTLYFPLERRYRRKAARPQGLLALLAVALSMAAMSAHYYLVLRPSQQVDLTLASVGYKPWYLLQEERVATAPITVGGETEVPLGQKEAPEVALRPQATGFTRPRVVPEPDVRYSPSQIEPKVVAYLEARGAGPARGDLADKARELAAAYAAGRASGLSTFSFAPGLERSVLERGWLWDLREGCEAQIYLKFPPGQLDAMGCGLAAIPVGRPFGVSVAFIERGSAGRRPAVAVVWEGN